MQPNVRSPHKNYVHDSAVPLALQINSISRFAVVKVTCIIFNIYGSVHPKNILIYIRQDATLHSLFYLETALHVSGGTTTHEQERKQLYPQHLVFLTPLPLPAAKAAGSSKGVITNTRCCRYSCFALLMMGEAVSR